MLLPTLLLTTVLLAPPAAWQDKGPALPTTIEQALAKELLSHLESLRDRTGNRSANAPAPPGFPFDCLDQLDGVSSAWRLSGNEISARALGLAVLAAAQAVDAERLRERVDGRISHDGIASLRAVVELGEMVLEWPIAQRPNNRQGDPGALHAKFAVADGRTLLVTSANLTEVAFETNIEFGVLIRGGACPSRVAGHCLWLVETGQASVVHVEEA